MPDVTSAAKGRGLELCFGDTIALAESDFEVPGSGLTSLIGPNGSGKSTVLSAIAGLHRASAGSITVLGGQPTETRALVAFVPQATKVNDTLPVTVREVVAMGRYASLGLIRRFTRADQSVVDGALERLDLAGLAGRHLRELSGGQRQRVFVAQGLVQDRELLLMDEPMTALDLVSSQVIREALEDERKAGRPVVVTTHDLSDAQAADHVVLLANRVVAQGPPGDVLTAINLSAAYRHDIAEIAGHVHIDDAAHSPTARRHTHVDPPRLG